MFLLDTNVISELRKAEFGKAHASVAAWADSVDADALFLSVITIMELETGVLLMARKDPRTGQVLQRWLDVVLHEFKYRILPFSLDASRHCARLHVPHRRAGLDAFIAATAQVYGMTVVTRNTKDFVPTGITLLNPWEFC